MFKYNFSCYKLKFKTIRKNYARKKMVNKT